MVHARSYFGVFAVMAAMALMLTLPSLASATPANDHFADAQAISGETASIEGTTAGATREIGEPDHYTSNDADADAWQGDHTVWYGWTAPSSGWMSVDTCTANIDSILAVYTGGSLDALSRVGDNNNDYCGGGWGSKVTFEATAGTTYQIAVGDAGGLRENTFTLNIQHAPPPPPPGQPNDHFADAQTISGASVSVDGTNIYATTEPNEPSFAGSSSSVWYRWTAPATGPVMVNTCSGITDFDTVLGVYTGTTLGSLTRVAANDDSCGWGSEVYFDGTAGTTYHIRVASYGDRYPGYFTLDLVSYGTPGDTTAPVISGMPSDITETATGSNGAQVSWQAPTATDDVDGDVDVECSPASGGTFPLGTTAVTCTAEDAAGNQATETFTVNVTYAWSGLLQPINGGSTLNDRADDTSSFKLGSTVPVKFRLTGGSAGIMGVTANIIVVKLDGTPDGTVVETSSTNTPDSGTTFRYDPTNAQYIFNLGTKGLTAGDYLVKIDLGDGTTASNTVKFSLKR